MADYGPFGGSGGGVFDDNDPTLSNILISLNIPNLDHLAISEIRINSGKFIDSIELVYRDSHGIPHSSGRHGGTGGTAQPPIFLARGEYITEIRGRTGQFVDSLTLQTNQGRIFPNPLDNPGLVRFGGSGGTADYDAPNQQEQTAGHEVFAFWGRATEYLDAIAIHTRPH